MCTVTIGSQQKREEKEREEREREENPKSNTIETLRK